VAGSARTARSSHTVEEDLPITPDMLDEKGNCISCGRPLDETTSHGFPAPCRNKVMRTGE
jgi:hypothetical protein